MKAIDIDQEEMDEVLSHLPPNIQEKLKGAITELRPTTGINTVRNFVQQYDDQDELDRVISVTCSSLIMDIAQTSLKELRKVKSKGASGLTGHDVAMIVIRCLKQEIERILGSIEEHNKNCNNH